MRTARVHGIWPPTCSLVPTLQLSIMEALLWVGIVEKGARSLSSQSRTILFPRERQATSSLPAQCCRQASQETWGFLPPPLPVCRRKALSLAQEGPDCLLSSLLIGQRFPARRGKLRRNKLPLPPSALLLAGVSLREVVAHPAPSFEQWCRGPAWGRGALEEQRPA